MGFLDLDNKESVRTIRSFRVAIWSCASLIFLLPSTPVDAIFTTDSGQVCMPNSEYLLVLDHSCIKHLQRKEYQRAREVKQVRDWQAANRESICGSTLPGAEQALQEALAARAAAGEAWTCDPPVDIQAKNLASAIAKEALQDGHLTLSEATKIYRANSDPDFRIIVQADQLSVSQTDMFTNGNAPGYVRGTDYFVHGQVTLRLSPDGAIRIYDGKYDFEYHKVDSAKDVLRNIETFVGATIAGEGTGYWIRYEGNANVVGQ